MADKLPFHSPAWASRGVLAAGMLLLAGAAGCPPPAGQTGRQTPATGPVVARLSPRQADAEIRGNADVFLLCVADREDYDEGHLAGSVLIPAMGLEFNLERNDLFPDINRRRAPRKDQPIIIYCTGKPCACPSYRSESDAAAAVLLQKGYRNLSIIDGGMRAWVKAGLPVEKKD